MAVNPYKEVDIYTVVSWQIHIIIQLIICINNTIVDDLISRYVNIKMCSPFHHQSVELDAMNNYIMPDVYVSALLFKVKFF